MRFKSTKIKFDGKTPHDVVEQYKGEVWLATSENDMYKEQFSGEREIIETSIPGRDQPYFHRVDTSPLEFNMLLAFESGIKESELSKIMKWLFQKDYKKLEFGMDEEGTAFQSRSFWVIFNNQPKVEYTFVEPDEGEDQIVGYIKLRARCNSSTGFEEETIDLLSTTETVKLNNEKGVLPLIYKISVDTSAGSFVFGDIEIDGNALNNTIEIDSSAKTLREVEGDTTRNVYKDWNKQWLRVEPGESIDVNVSGVETGSVEILRPVYI